MEFEDILVKVGDFGKYQRNLMLYFLYPASAILPLFSMNILFLVSVPDHWCFVPELEFFNLTEEEEKFLVRPPGDPTCSTFDVNYTDLLSHSENLTFPEGTKTRPCYSGWRYDRKDYDSTAASMWNLVCGDLHFVSLVLTLASVGSVFGTPLYGALSDKMGRKPIFFVTVFVTCISGVTSVLMKDFTAFVVFRIINGTIMPSIFQLPYIIHLLSIVGLCCYYFIMILFVRLDENLYFHTVLEIVGPTMRTRMNGITNTSWTFGLCILPLLAWLSRSWIILGLITSSFTILFLIYWKILPESPRWLISQGRYSEATGIMMNIAKKNGKYVTADELFIQLQELGERCRKEKQMEKEGQASDELSPKVFFKYPQLRKRFFILTYCFIANIAAYYGLQINASNIDGNEFLNFFLLGIMELPGYLFSWFFMERFGRRWCSVLTLLITGAACLVPVFEPNAGVAPSLVGKFGSAAAFMAMYQQSSEMYPTTVRALGMGLSGTVAVLTTIAVPYIVYLAEYGKYIPFLIISVICLTAGLTAAFLPETLNENLPQTVQDAETFGIHQRFCSCNRRRRPSCYEQCPQNELKANVELTNL